MTRQGTAWSIASLRAGRLERLGRVLVASILISAGAGKLAAQDQDWPTVLARLLPNENLRILFALLEIVFGIWIATTQKARFAWSLTTINFAMFSAILWRLVANGEVGACGCLPTISGTDEFVTSNSLVWSAFRSTILFIASLFSVVGVHRVAAWTALHVKSQVSDKSDEA